MLIPVLAISIDLSGLSSQQLLGVLFGAFIFLLFIFRVLYSSFKDSFRGVLPSLKAKAAEKNAVTTMEVFLEEARKSVQDELNDYQQVDYSSLRALMVRLGVRNTSHQVTNYPVWKQRLGLFDKEKFSSLGTPLVRILSRGCYIQGKHAYYIVSRFLKHTLELIQQEDEVQILVDSKTIGHLDLGRQKISGKQLSLSYRIQGIFKTVQLWPHITIEDGRKDLAKIVFKENLFQFLTNPLHSLPLFIQVPREEDKDLLIYALGVFYFSFYNRASNRL